MQTPGADTLPIPASSALLDSVVVEPAVPDPLVPIVQWIFQRPPWVMQLGIVLAALVAATLFVLAWRRRRAISAWLGSRSPRTMYALAGGLAVIGFGVAAYGGMLWGFKIEGRDDLATVINKLRGRPA